MSNPSSIHFPIKNELDLDRDNNQQNKKRKLDQVSDNSFVGHKRKIHKLDNDNICSLVHQYGNEPNKIPGKPPNPPNNPPNNPPDNPPNKTPDNSSNNKSPNRSTNPKNHTNDPKNHSNNPMPIIFFLNELNKYSSGVINDSDDDLDDFFIPPEVECGGRFCDHDLQSLGVRAIPEKFLSKQNKYC